jgi:type II secretory pathway pseudopilin PulG
MGLLFPVLGSAKNQARRSDAGVAVRAIVSACKSYQTDYGKFPPVPGAGGANGAGYYSYGDTQAGKCSTTNNNLFDVLRSINRGVNSSPIPYALNPRQQSYFSMPVAKNLSQPRDGFVDGSTFTGGIPGALMDPWGTQYCVVLDAADAGTIDMSNFYSDFQTSNPVSQSAVAFSMGTDGQLGGKGYQGAFRPTNSSSAPDDIVSWQ